jgi:CMP-N-acetylneuraminic acid synthetase
MHPTHYVRGTIKYDESVLPAAALPGLLAEMLEDKPMYLSGSTVDESREMRDIVEYARAVERLGSTPNSVNRMGMASMARFSEDGCVTFDQDELDYLLGNSSRSAAHEDEPEYVYAHPRYRYVEGWCGRRGLQSLVHNYSAHTTPPAIERYGSCAVVGSAGDLAGSELGSTIDQHDTVIRVNSAPTRGHTRDVGTRTTIRVASVSTMIIDQLKEAETMLLIPTEGLCPFYAAYLRWIEKGEHGIGQSMHMISFSMYSLIVRRWLNMLGEDASRRKPDNECGVPSAGVVALLWAVRACRRVSIFGYTLTANVSTYDYYFDKAGVTRTRPMTSATVALLDQIRNQQNPDFTPAGRTGNDACHDLEYERGLARRLVHFGVVTPPSNTSTQALTPSTTCKTTSSGVVSLPSVQCPSGSARPDAQIVAFVGARAGSQRVPEKNIRPFWGNQSLLEIGLGELTAALHERRGAGTIPPGVVFSSDSEKYNEIARRFPGVAAEMRDPYFASSTCTVSEYHGHVGTVMQKTAPHASHVLFFQVTQPLLNRTTISRFIDTFCNTPPEQHDALLSVAEKVGHFIDRHGKPVNFDPNNIQGSQDLDPMYVAGKMTILPVKHTLEYKNLLGQAPKLFPLDGYEAIDIDDYKDFEIAQYLYKKRQDARGNNNAATEISEAAATRETMITREVS